MDCRIATDQLFSYLSSEDFPKMKYLLDQIMQASIIFSDICEKEYVAYRKISDIKARRTALETIELEKKYPNSFTEKDLSFCASVLERTKNLKYDEIWGDIGKASRELADAYDHVYRNKYSIQFILICESEHVKYCVSEEKIMQTLDMGDKEQDDQYPSQSVAAQE